MRCADTDFIVKTDKLGIKKITSYCQVYWIDHDMDGNEIVYPIYEWDDLPATITLHDVLNLLVEVATNALR